MPSVPVNVKCRVCGQMLHVEVQYIGERPKDCLERGAIKIRWHGWTSMGGDQGPWICPADKGFVGAPA